MTDAERFVAEFRRTLIALYIAQLRKLWRYAAEVMVVRRAGRQGLYRMLFASNHEAGKDIADWARRRTQASGLGSFGF